MNKPSLTPQCGMPAGRGHGFGGVVLPRRAIASASTCREQGAASYAVCYRGSRQVNAW